MLRPHIAKYAGDGDGRGNDEVIWIRQNDRITVEILERRTRVPSVAPKASEIDRNVTAALRELYSHNEAAKRLGAQAKAVLVFPD
jgi:hypothetical protein